MATRTAQLTRWARRAIAGVVKRALRLRRGASVTSFRSGDPVMFLIWNAHSMGGTVRTVLRQAEDLLDRGHPVTVVSVVKHPKQDGAFFPIDERIRHEVLVDRPAIAQRSGIRAGLLRWLDDRRSVLPDLAAGRRDQASLLVDLRLVARVARAREGVVIGTRLGLNFAIAEFGHPAAVRVAQEHLYLDVHAPRLRNRIGRAYRHLDVVACLSNEDATAYRELLAGAPTRVVVMPNSIPDRLPEPSPHARDRIVAVGRFTRMKGFDLLVEAFARVADEFPTWDLQIIGKGPDRKALRGRVRELGLRGRVALPGPSKEVQRELNDASVFVLSSRFEPFGIVLLEAMSTGLCVVSFACPKGPREILEHERTALLVPPEDVEAMAVALRRALRDERLRRRIGQEARREVQRYTAERVGERWIRVFADAAAARAGDTVLARVGSSSKPGVSDRSVAGRH